MKPFLFQFFLALVWLNPVAAWAQQEEAPNDNASRGLPEAPVTGPEGDSQAPADESDVSAGVVAEDAGLGGEVEESPVEEVPEEPAVDTAEEAAPAEQPSAPEQPAVPEAVPSKPLPPKVSSPPQRSVEADIQGHFLTILHVRNDSDFDPTERYYDRDGQTEGQVATFFRPELSLSVKKRFRILYEVELGWNVWSRNDPGQPNQFFPVHQPGLNLRHRQLWAAYRFSDQIELTVGYQHLSDPSRLFLDYLGGALRLDADWDRGILTAWVGQLPDTTYEGVALTGDNFVTDSVFGGLQNVSQLGNFTLEAAVYGVADFRLLGRPLYLGTLVVGGQYARENVRAWAHLLAQAGSWQNSGVNGADQTILAWAAQAGISQQWEKLSWRANLFALSPDDDGNGNRWQGSFFASGKNESSTLIMTEDEFRDRYDNLDERMGSAWGPFFLHRAGVAVADASIGYRVARWYEPRLIAGVGVNLNPVNSMGHPFVGIEGVLVNAFPVADQVLLFANLMLVVPGRGASVFVNDVDREARRPIYGGQVGFAAQF